MKKTVFGLLTLSLTSSALALTNVPAVSAQRAAQVALTTTTSNTDPAYQALLTQAEQALLGSLKDPATGAVTAKTAYGSNQTAPLSDDAWLKASGYDFKEADNQAEGIKILSGFTTLPRTVLVANDAGVAAINKAAPTAQQNYALFDADGYGYLYFLSDALGPKLGKAFLNVYSQGKIGKAAALIKASEISTSAAKKAFNYPRPFLIDNNTIKMVKDNVIIKDGSEYPASGGAFPSGHTNVGFTDGLLLAEMLPERFPALLNRAAGYGYSRVVLGVHYPLDVIGSRLITQRNVANFLNDPAYRKLFGEARDQLRAALEAECGSSISVCAQPMNAATDPWMAPAQNDFWNYTLTYGLPQTGKKDVPMQVPAGAEVLLSTLRPDLSPEALRAVLQDTAQPSGAALDSSDPATGFWERLNLRAAVEKLTNK